MREAAISPKPDTGVGEEDHDEPVSFTPADVAAEVLARADDLLRPAGSATSPTVGQWAL